MKLRYLEIVWLKIFSASLFSRWIKTDAIIGNPLFLGGQRIHLELSDNYAEKVFN
ncbi:MAG: hypothetical protein IGQ45_15780 [Cyanobacterium sp. T60_A2020_053]|nr:hypothetical protein [Cyanobacterium sp. T60_A2020_053]